MRRDDVRADDMSEDELSSELERKTWNRWEQSGNCANEALDEAE